MVTMDPIRTIGRSARSLLTLALLTTLGTPGCLVSSDVESLEPVDSSEEPFSTGACATAPPDKVFVANSGAVTTPTNYNSCGKGYIVDVYHSASTQATVMWADSLPTTAAGCRDISVTVKYYEHRSGSGTVFVSDHTRNGIWIAFPGVCFPPAVSFPVTPGDYRIASTARITTGELTRKHTVAFGN
jgi:hypothetical protein